MFLRRKWDSNPRWALRAHNRLAGDRLRPTRLFLRRPLNSSAGRGAVKAPKQLLVGNPALGGRQPRLSVLAPALARAELTETGQLPLLVEPLALEPLAVAAEQASADVGAQRRRLDAQQLTGPAGGEVLLTLDDDHHLPKYTAAGGRHGLSQAQKAPHGGKAIHNCGSHAPTV